MPLAHAGDSCRGLSVPTCALSGLLVHYGTGPEVCADIGGTVDPKKLFYDDRLKVCAYCGGPPDTVDHVPSRVLLDEPYPPNLPVVACCERCNHSFSADEPYVACLVECAVAGSCEPEVTEREKVRRLLKMEPALARSLDAARVVDPHNAAVAFMPDRDRLMNVVMKLARGHVAYRTGELVLQQPSRVNVAPLHTLTLLDLTDFETEPIERILPEVGSRAYAETLLAEDVAFAGGGWQVVQRGRYRYLVTWSDGLSVRMVLSEYLACSVTW